MGDSISTYSGWSNNKDFNSSIGSNAVWYPNSNNPNADMNVELTWWHRTFTEGNYDLCVNNSWSGSKVSDEQTYNVRAQNLHNTTTGAKPDIIIILMGINDWAEGIIVGNYDGTNMPPDNPATFSEAYGIMLTNVKKTYPNAKIYCCTLLPDCKRGNNGLNSSGISQTIYNDAICTIAQDMGVNLIDLHSEVGITPENISQYTTDLLHPNVAGMEKIAGVILESIGS